MVRPNFAPSLRFLAELSEILTSLAQFFATFRNIFSRAATADGVEPSSSPLQTISKSTGVDHHAAAYLCQASCFFWLDVFIEYCFFWEEGRCIIELSSRLAWIKLSI
jgi:hypothetical protein